PAASGISHQSADEIGAAHRSQGLAVLYDAVFAAPDETARMVAALHVPGERAVANGGSIIIADQPAYELRPGKHPVLQRYALDRAARVRIPEQADVAVVRPIDRQTADREAASVEMTQEPVRVI